MSESSKKITVIYLRISSDDDNIGDSESISGQRNLLTEFINNHPILQDTQIIEVVDDGYSGTNFDRPGVQELLNSVRRGTVGCIIVKDFSRWGRNYIIVGDYLEHLFPFLGVRFISVVDDYDSDRPDCGPGDINIAFKHIMHSYYAKDLSQKIRAANRVKMERGEFKSRHTLFGYKKTANSHVLEIDEPAAAIVRRAFELIFQGLSTFDVAKLFNTEGIPTQSVYKQRTGNSQSRGFATKNNIWTPSSILRLVTNVRYTGCMISGVYERVEIGKPKARKRPKEQWFVHEGIHPAIISKEDLNKARVCIKIRKHGSLQRREYLLKGKLRCGKCGHMLVRSGSNKIRYTCSYGKAGASGPCFYDTIKEDDVEVVLRRAIQSKLETFAGDSEVKEQHLGKLNDVNTSIARLQRQVKSLKAKKVSFYERYTDGGITKDEFLKDQNLCEEQIALILVRLSELEKMKAEDYRAKEPSAFEVFNSVKKGEKLTRDVVDAFIEHVIIYRDNHYEIIWKTRGGNFTYNLGRDRFMNKNHDNHY